MKNNFSVCAIVVTYNRKEMLLECLTALRKQTLPLQGIYIIDNASTDGTPSFLKKNGYIKELPPDKLIKPWEKEFEIKNFVDNKPIRIHYIRMHENTGGAGGFYEGVKRAFEKGYDWLWLMDDDAEPKENAIEVLSKFFNKKGISGLACSVVFPDGKIDIKHRGLIDFNNVYPIIQKPLSKENYYSVREIDMASFVGFMINRVAIQKIGYPKKEFFIHYDDTEYSIRLRQVGKILLIPNCLIVHKDISKKGTIKHFFWMKKERLPYEKFWIVYYGIRNWIWLGRKYSTNRLNFLIGTIKLFFRSTVGVLLFDEKKLKRTKLILSAFFDGFRGNFDNEKPKRILYGDENK